ncbi:uncharacterized protein LOC142844261 [Microtus pennsylvanicus]|uniref:uncharacterized protein LOC142844261 n=1 Tax=Microtus pennsylvanicus TaxID=10058 RepID=UPI003F6D2DAA
MKTLRVTHGWLREGEADELSLGKQGKWGCKEELVFDYLFPSTVWREDGEPEESVRGPSRSDFPDKRRGGGSGGRDGLASAGVREQRPAGPSGRRGVGCPRAGRAPAPSSASAPPRQGRRRPAARRDPGPRPSAALVPLPGDLRPVLQLSGPRRPRAVSGSLGAGVPSAGALTAVLGVRRAALGSGIGRSPVRPGGTRFPGCPASAPRDGLPRRGSAQPAPVHPGALPKPLPPLQPLPPLPLALLPLRHAGDREPTTERILQRWWWYPLLIDAVLHTESLLTVSSVPTYSEAKEGGRIIVEVEDKVAKIRNLKVNSRPESSGDTREKVVAFGFDYCYWSVNPEDPQYASQEVVFQDLGTEVLSGAAQGYNICLFAYGQTGSGKTYTMLGTPASVGLTPRICEALFIREDGCASLPSSCSIKVSYFSIAARGH